jgi:pilus assembly protein Flp/PilA
MKTEDRKPARPGATQVRNEKERVMKLNGRRGQGMTEYIIIVALIAIAAIGVVSLFGDNIRLLFATSANALAGNENAKTNTKESVKKLHGHRGMKDFAENNKR